MKQSDADAKYSAPASAVIGLLAYAAAARVPTAGVLEIAGLTPESLQGPEARVSHGACNKVWAALAERSGDPEFGLHFSERADVDALDVVGHLLARSATFGQGLERVCAYSRILHDAGRVEMERAGDHVIVYPGCRGLPVECPRHVAEFSAGSVVAMARALTGEPVVPVAVRFKHAAPARTREHLRVFGVVPTFGEPETAVELAASVLALPIRDAQPGVLTYLDAYARAAVSRLPAPDDIVDQVERVVTTSLSRGLPDMDQVAGELGLHARTLQRRLAEQGTTFQAVLDEVRRAYAERALRDDRLALTEIAFLLGFSDPSNFHRAFRRWTGTTPAAFREASRAPLAAG
ncbi:MAG: AraC family transcriptional regulator [Minicystis sp.]